MLISKGCITAQASHTKVSWTVYVSIDSSGKRAFVCGMVGVQNGNDKSWFLQTIKISMIHVGMFFISLLEMLLVTIGAKSSNTHRLLNPSHTVPPMMILRFLQSPRLSSVYNLFLPVYCCYKNTRNIQNELHLAP